MSVFENIKGVGRGQLAATCLVLVVLASGCNKPNPAPAPKPVAPPKVAPVVAAKTNDTTEYVSVFEELPPQVGKDPFFPTSHRREPTPVTPVPQPTQVAPTLVLKGIVGSVGHRMAIINNETMEMGEESSVRTPAGHVRVKCIEIDENSATVQVEGEPQPKKLVMEQKK